MPRVIIPMEVKRAKGTYRKDRDRNPPPADKAKPVAPKWLNRRAKYHFKVVVGRLDALGMASSSYTEAIALLASRLEEVERFTEVMDKEGAMYEFKTRDHKIVTRPHPVTEPRNKAMAHVHKLLTEFGLTASSIQKIGKPGGKQKKNEFDGF